MDWIFKIGIFMLPFENLFFAPSSGWATITPIIFFIYLLFNLKLAIKSICKYRYIFIFLIAGFIISAINYSFVGVEIRNLINATISLALGITNLISIDIYFRQKNNKIDKCVKLLIITYTISLVIGWIQFLTIKLDIEILKDLFINIEKRSYIKYNRVQFTFTEPSFIGMHLFGILLPIYMYTKKKTLLSLIGIFAISAIIFSSGVRILIDMIVVITICYIIYFIKNRKNKKVIISTIMLLIIILTNFTILYKTNYRIKSIINNGIYADGSLASRYFRINASVKGVANDCRLLTGYGLGNELLAIKSGYEQAMNEYKSSYTNEMEQLANPSYTDDSVSYCLYTRITSEFGIIFLIATITYIYQLSRKSSDLYLKNYIWILFYIYSQFESYAFYTIWLYIVLINIEKKNNNEVLENKNNKILNNNDLISIIIPVYNAEKYLKECIESIRNQTYKNLEIILIDDGSTDMSSIICDNYAKKDSRIKVIHEKNSGVSEARNRGIKEAKGKWISFIDSDDYIDLKFCEKMLSAVVQTKSQCVMCAYNKIYNDNTITILKQENIQLKGKEFLNKIFEVQSGFGFCHMKLWDSKIIKNNAIYFDKNLKVAEDALFCIMISNYIKDIYFLNEALYNYRINSESAVRKFDQNYTEKYLKAMIKTKDYVEKNEKEEKNIMFYNYVVYHLLLIIVNYCFHPKNNKKSIKLLKQTCEIPEFKESINKCNYNGFSFTRKITIFTLKHKLYFLTGVIANIRQNQINSK